MFVWHRLQLTAPRELKQLHMFIVCTMKPQLSELQLSKYSIIYTLCLSPCVYAYVDKQLTSIVGILDYPNVFSWSQLVQIVEVTCV